MPVYATPDDLAAWTGTAAPDGAARLLRSASFLVRQATITAVYTAGTDGIPTDTTLAAAMRDATCAQAAAWAAAGINPAAGPAGARVVSSSSIGGASVTYAGADTAATSAAASVDTLTVEATAILTDAGLTGHPRTW